MSLLEDVFLEDEAGEAQDLERVIEGDELDDRPRSPDSNENSAKEDEAEEDKRTVDPNAKKKSVVKKPRFVLNPARLTGPRGIQVVPEHFKDFKFKGKGHEREDLDFVLKKLEHWAYRLYPKFKFDDCLKKIETLGKKRPVMVHLHKIRTDQLSEDTVQQQESSGDEAPPPEDEFDRLLQQQIELARATPAPGSVRKEVPTPAATHRSQLIAPKASSSPSISDDQKERMMRNRKLAEERRLARLNQSHNASTHNDTSESIAERTEEINLERVDVNDAIVINDDVEKDLSVVKRQNRTNIIDSDSSDDENIVAVNESITVQVHNCIKNTEDNSDREDKPLEAMIVQSDQNAALSNVPVSKPNEIGIETVTEEDPKETNIIETNENNKGSVTDDPNETDQTEENENNKESEIEYDPKESEMAQTDLPDDRPSENAEVTAEVTEIISNDNDLRESNTIPPIVTNESKEVNENKDLVGEDLMDVDFSDDF